MENLTNVVKDQITYTYSDFLKDIRKIEEWLLPQRKGFTPFDIEPWEPDMIISINRGGLVPGVYLSHTLNVPHYPIHYQTRDFDQSKHEKSKWSFAFKPHAINHDKNILLVDDINDTGKTFTDIMEWWETNNLGEIPITKRVKTVTLVERASSDFLVDFSPTLLDNKKWVVFPWESQHRHGYDEE